MEKLTFKGKEFKGSEGEFEYKYPFIQNDMLFVMNGGFVSTVHAPDTNTKVESEANARLFANSKNLLKAAIDHIENPTDETKLKLETEILKSL